MMKTARTVSGLSVCLLLLGIPNVSSAMGHKTIWCTKFSIGCPDAKDWHKQETRCSGMASQSYEEAMIETFSDPSVWQLQGAANAQDYAKMRYQLMYSICMDY